MIKTVDLVDICRDENVQFTRRGWISVIGVALVHPRLRRLWYEDLDTF